MWCVERYLVWMKRGSTAWSKPAFPNLSENQQTPVMNVEPQHQDMSSRNLLSDPFLWGGVLCYPPTNQDGTCVSGYPGLDIFLLKGAGPKRRVPCQFIGGRKTSTPVFGGVLCEKCRGANFHPMRLGYLTPRPVHFPAPGFVHRPVRWSSSCRQGEPQQLFWGCFEGEPKGVTIWGSPILAYMVM